eukprot:CAMPEP_0204531066 /NCGR_PEP_ID=MMETSP0661-20131031/10964_1 /ASSEMBLY_ACC=CAM_ASM_000606 /TAXON_ID=109239 /ORGANISM="Alexandrium margalefi, Strain AMGDE01CS-322" /LENGTH=32 /DNA_ID= /DNA_START= /DNA_END= /DNA_ORIENTATION=
MAAWSSPSGAGVVMTQTRISLTKSKLTHLFTT